jgi:hypothetical protein
MKKLAAALLVVVAIAGGAVFWLSGNIDGLIKRAIANYGSAMTQTKVAVDEVKISPTDGKGTLGNLVIGNPSGFRTPHAMKIGRIDVHIDIASVARDVIVIRRIAIIAPELNYELGSTMTNFDAIQKNIASYLGSAENKKKGRHQAHRRRADHPPGQGTGQRRLAGRQDRERRSAGHHPEEPRQGQGRPDSR